MSGVEKITRYDHLLTNEERLSAYDEAEQDRKAINKVDADVRELCDTITQVHNSVLEDYHLLMNVTISSGKLVIETATQPFSKFNLRLRYSVISNRRKVRELAPAEEDRIRDLDEDYAKQVGKVVDSGHKKLLERNQRKAYLEKTVFEVTGANGVEGKSRGNIILYIAEPGQSSMSRTDICIDDLMSIVSPNPRILPTERDVRDAVLLSYIKLDSRMPSELVLHPDCIRACVEEADTEDAMLVIARNPFPAVDYSDLVGHVVKQLIAGRSTSYSLSPEGSTFHGESMGDAMGKVIGEITKVDFGKFWPPERIGGKKEE